MIEYIVVGGVVYCGYQMVITTKELVALQKEGKRLARLRHMVENTPKGTNFFPKLLKTIKQDITENPMLYKQNIPRSSGAVSHSKSTENIKINYSFSL